MGVRVALLSGGKDSFYAAMHYWPPDYGLVLHYEAPEPSPHLLNLGRTVETLLLAGVRVLVLPLPRGREREATVKALRLLGADEIIAGDVYVEDHLRYLEGIAGEAGARLREPLWGRDTRELLHEIVEAGLRSIITGVRGGGGQLLGTVLGPDTVEQVEEWARRHGWDPLGENGEYHTLLLDTPHHTRPLSVEACSTLVAGGMLMLKLCPA